MFDILLTNLTAVYDTLWYKVHPVTGLKSSCQVGYVSDRGFVMHAGKFKYFPNPKTQAIKRRF